MAIIGTDSLSRTLATLPDGFFPSLTQFSDDADLRQFAWELTRTLTGGEPVRAYLRAANGVIENTVPFDRPTRAGAQAPDTTWALRLVYNGATKLVGFDFDAKDECSTRDAEQDCLQLRKMLKNHGIETAMFHSGGGGFHLWLGLAFDSDDVFTAAELRKLGEALKVLFPRSFDLAPLRSAATGCLRAPYAPHRNETTYSHPYTTQEPASVLLNPSTTAAELRGFLTATEEAAAPKRTRELVESPVNDPGNRFEKDPLQGAWRLRGKRDAGIPKFIQQLASGEVTITDSSQRIVTYFTAAIRARWTLADALAFGKQHPHLTESAYSRPAGDSRVPRSTGSAYGYAEHQWTVAATYVERHLHINHAYDPTPPPEELKRTLLAIEHAWERFKAQTARFADAGITIQHTYAAVLSYMARSMKTNVGAPVRELAITAGTNRTSARDALVWLVKEGLLVRHARSEYAVETEMGLSRTPFSYSLPELSTSPDDTFLTLVGSNTTPPPGVDLERFADLWERRTRLMEEIQGHFEDARPEMFVRPVDGGLGKKAAQIAMWLVKGALTIAQLAKLTKTPEHRIKRIIQKLEGVRVVAGGFGKGVKRKTEKWWRQVALEQFFLPAATVLGKRAQLYMREQKLWQWMLIELSERRKRLKDRAADRLTFNQLRATGVPLFPTWPVFPTIVSPGATPDALPVRRLDMLEAMHQIADYFYGVRFHVARAA